MEHDSLKLPCTPGLLIAIQINNWILHDNLGGGHRPERLCAVKAWFVHVCEHLLALLRVLQLDDYDKQKRWRVFGTRDAARTHLACAKPGYSAYSSVHSLTHAGSCYVLCAFVSLCENALKSV